MKIPILSLGSPSLPPTPLVPACQTSLTKVVDLLPFPFNYGYYRCVRLTDPPLDLDLWPWAHDISGVMTYTRTPVHTRDETTLSRSKNTKRYSGHWFSVLHETRRRRAKRGFENGKTTHSHT